MITAGHLLLIALATFVATSVLWLVVNKRAVRHYETRLAVSAAELQMRADAMKVCPGCTRRLKRYAGKLAA